MIFMSCLDADDFLGFTLTKRGFGFLQLGIETGCGWPGGNQFVPP